MRKNEIIRELDKKIEFVKRQVVCTETYRVGLIRGLEIAKETVENFKRR